MAQGVHTLLAVQVRLLKCLVDDIVVDISFETLGGLCTVAFLESIDRKLQENNLFKRSIILVRRLRRALQRASCQLRPTAQACSCCTGEGLVLL